MGYYGGNGARLIATVNPVGRQTQPDCLTNARNRAGRLRQLGRVRLLAGPGRRGVRDLLRPARPHRRHERGQPRLVRRTRRRQPLGPGVPDVRHDLAGVQQLRRQQPLRRFARRPGVQGELQPAVHHARATAPEDFVFNAEYPMVRFLEANGYDVSYIAGADTDRRGALLRNHKVFLSVGHDEYWSGRQRANVEAARDAGVNLAFFSGNEVFWKTRWENSVDGSGTAVPHAGLATRRPTRTRSSTRRSADLDRHLARPAVQPAGRRRPPGERADRHGLQGQRAAPSTCGSRPPTARCGSGADTSVATLRRRRHRHAGHRRPSATSGTRTPTTALRPGGPDPDVHHDRDRRRGAAGPRVAPTATGTATHNLTLYRAPSGALVFGAGTVQWSWGLDSNHDRGSGAASAPMRQATVNLFADMGAQPATLQSGLVAADRRPPTRSARRPRSPRRPPARPSRPARPVTITGTATDTGGGVVGGVEVSTDGGATWHPATGRGSLDVRLDARQPRRRHDPGPGHRRQRQHRRRAASATVTVAPRACPCSIWGAAATPAVAGRPRHRRRRGRRQVPRGRRRQVTASASTRAPATPAPTSATSGRRPATQLASVTFTGESADRLAAGEPVHPGRAHRRHHLRGLLLRAERALRGRRQLLRHPGRRQRPAARPAGRRRRRPTASTATARRRLPDPDLRVRQLLGRRGLLAGSAPARTRRRRP